MRRTIVIAVAWPATIVLAWLLGTSFRSDESERQPRKRVDVPTERIDRPGARPFRDVERAPREPETHRPGTGRTPSRRPPAEPAERSSPSSVRS